jgi:rhamnose transport system permease protein
MNTLRRIIRPEQIRELSLLLIVIVAILIFGSQINEYYTGRTFNRISTSVAIILVVAVGETLVVLTRNIDLSVGSVVGFTAYFVGQQLSNNNDIPPLVVVAMAMGFGAVLGLINGLLVAYGNIPAVVVTLGTLAVYRGILIQYSNAQTILTSRLPQWLGELPRDNIFSYGEWDFRLLVGIGVLVVIIFHLVLVFSSFGRRLYAIGSNPDAARIAGIPSRRLIVIAFILSGTLAGLGGFMFLARFGTITVEAGRGMELQAVAVAVVGGVNIFGGSGTMLGVMLGAVLIGTLEQSLIRMQDISEFWKDALQGLFILLAVATDAVILNRLRTFWARGEIVMHETATSQSGGQHGA